MANNNSGIPMPTDQQASNRSHRSQISLIPPTTHAGPSTEVNYPIRHAQTPPTLYGPTLGMGMNASVGTQAQSQDRMTPNITPLRPLSSMFPFLEARLAESGFVIQRQPQNLQPTVHVPAVREQEGGLYPTLPIDSDEPRPVLPEERQQATPPASATARQQHQDPQPTEVPVPNATELAPRNQPIQRQRSYYLPNIAPRILAALSAVGNWIHDIAKWISNVLWEFLPTIVKWISNFLWAVSKLLTIRNISIIMMILAWWFRYQLVGVYVCPKVNAFCEVRYNPFRPMVCPVTMCVEYSYPNTSGTAAAPSAPLSGEVVPEGDRNNQQEDSEYIRSLFRIPHALKWTSKSLKEHVFWIQRSSMPDKKKEALATTLVGIIKDMETMIPGIDDFDLNYIHTIGILHKHVRLFESVFSKIINDSAGSAYPDRGFLRHHHHHHTSAAGWGEGIYAFVRRTALWLANERDGDGAETTRATTILQTRFEEYVISSIAPLHFLNSSACGIHSALSLLHQRLETFSIDAKGAAYSLHENNHDEEIDKKDTGGGFSSIGGNLFQKTEMERALKKKEENKIDADTGLLKRCEGDLMDALEVLGGANSRISQAETAIKHLGVRLHKLSAKDMHDGWGSASVNIITRDLSDFMGWMDGGEVEFKKLMKEAEEEEVKKWNKSIILKN